MEPVRFDEFPSTLRKTLIDSYGEWFRLLWDSRKFELYLVVIMFNHLKLQDGPRLDQMVAESEHFYRAVMLNSQRKPRALARQVTLPMMLGHPDLPVRKAGKMSVPDVRINHGMHMNFMVAVPIGQMSVPLDQHVQESPAIYYGSRGLKKRIHVERVDKTPAKATRYVMKFLGRGQFGLDHAFIMPKAVSELPNRIPNAGANGVAAHASTDSVAKVARLKAARLARDAEESPRQEGDSGRTSPPAPSIRTRHAPLPDAI